MEIMAVRSVKGRCRRCYQCIRSCPVKAIRVREAQAAILGNRCVSCGFCTIVCNQRAAVPIESKKAVLSLLEEGKYVVAILDPSFVASFHPHHPLEVVRALKDAGFREVWDGGIGTGIIVQEYQRLLKEYNGPLISSHCHVVVNLIEKHYPRVLPYLAQVVSPMIGAARFIRRALLPKEIKVVYIGPCIAKKNEARDDAVKGEVDEVLTFKEVEEILSRKKVSFKKRAPFDGYTSGMGRLIAMAGGLSKEIGLSQDISESLILITGGIERCRNVLDALQKRRINFRFLDLTFCQAGCVVDGPAIHSNLNPFTRRQILVQYAKKGNGEIPLDELKGALPDLKRRFTNRFSPLPKPSPSQIKETLASMDKHKREDELNCGACGYPTCREKAVAVFQGLAEVEMCLPYLIAKVKEVKEREFETLVEQVGEGIVAIDTGMRITLFNKAAEEITGYPKNEVIGRLCKEVFHGDRCDTPDCPYKIALTTGETLSNLETTILTKDGERIPIRSSIALMRDEGGRVIGGIKAFTDVSKLKEIEEMKDEFVSHVSHELRTPIASIKGSVDLLLSGTEGEVAPQQREFLEIVKNNIDRLIKLITDLLDLSKLEAGRLELRLKHLSIKDLVDDVLSDIGVLAEDKGLKVEVDIPEGIPMVPMDGDRIKQVLTNLVSNAIKYTSKGQIYISARESEEELVTSIRDTGMGIPSSAFKQIFEKFRPVDPNQPKGKSIGLGLPICKGIVEAHHGRIWVESEVGKGSTFHFALPKEKRRREREEAPPAPKKEGLFAVKKVLVVDDDVEMAKVFSDFLEKEGYEVEVAYDGDEAISKSRSFNPDLITLDILMPGMDGFEVLERLRGDETTEDIPVIIVSVVKDPDQRRLMSLGIANYLHKPVDGEELVRQIKEIEDWINHTKTRKMVLIVEDERAQVKIIRDVLERAGYHSIEAYTGEEAIALAKRHHPDLILLDLGLPGIDGIEVIKRLKRSRKTSSIPVVVLTIRDIESEKTKALDLGASEYMVKPFDQDVLVAKIREKMKEEVGW